MEEQRKEEKMRQREFCIRLSFSGTLSLGENVPHAKGLARFSEKRKKVKNQVFSKRLAPFLRSRRVLDRT